MKNHRLENVVTKHKMQTKCTQKIQRTPTHPIPQNNPKEKTLSKRNHG